jgi:ABC-2 type transport system permease protein
MTETRTATQTNNKTAPVSAVPARSTVPARRLLGLHARYQVLETIRVPIAVVGTALFPALSMLFFVTPNASVANDPLIATGATAQLAVFSVMSVCLFTYGVGVAEDRALPWDAYLRTLPAGPGPRLGGRLLNGLAFSLLGLTPLLVLSVLLTAASVTPSRFVAAVGALIVGALPFLGAGLAVGYALPAKAALAVAQLLLFPLAFAGGLFLPPELFPGWLDALSQGLPSRAARDLVVGIATGTTVPVTTLLVLAGWTLVTGALALVAYRRDEGRRFR